MRGFEKKILSRGSVILSDISVREASMHGRRERQLGGARAGARDKSDPLLHFLSKKMARNPNKIFKLTKIKRCNHTSGRAFERDAPLLNFPTFLEIS